MKLIISIFLLVGLVGTASAVDCVKSWSTTGLTDVCTCKQGPIGMYVTGANPSTNNGITCQAGSTCTSSTIVADTQRVVHGGVVTINANANPPDCTVVKCSNTAGTVNVTSPCRCPSGKDVFERSFTSPTKCEGEQEQIGDDQKELTVGAYCIGSNYYAVNKKTSGIMSSGNQDTPLKYEGTTNARALCNDNKAPTGGCTCHSASSYHGGTMSVTCTADQYCMKNTGFIYTGTNMWDGVEANKNVISAQTECMDECAVNAVLSKKCVCTGSNKLSRNVAGEQEKCKADGSVERPACGNTNGKFESRVLYTANGPYKSNGCTCGTGTPDVCTHGQYCLSTADAGSRCLSIPLCEPSPATAVASTNSAATCTCGTNTCITGQTCITGGECEWPVCPPQSSYLSASQAVSNQPFSGAVVTNPGNADSFGGAINNCKTDIKKCVCSKDSSTTSNCGNNQVCDKSTGTCHVPACVGGGEISTYACQCKSKEDNQDATYSQCSAGQACHTSDVAKQAGICGFPICGNSVTDGETMMESSCACPTAQKDSHSMFTPNDYTIASPGQACYKGTASKAGKVGLVVCGNTAGRNPQNTLIVGTQRFTSQYTGYNHYAYETGTGMNRKMNPVSCSCGEKTSGITTTATCSYAQLCDVTSTPTIAKCWTPMCSNTDGSQVAADDVRSNTRGVGYSCICAGGPKANPGTFDKGADATCSPYQRCFGGFQGHPATGSGNTLVPEKAATAARCGCTSYNKHEMDGKPVMIEQLYAKHENEQCIDTYTKWEVGAEQADCTCIGGSGSGTGNAGADARCESGEVCVIGACATAMNGAGSKGECFDSASQVAASAAIALTFAGVVSMFA